MLHCSPHRLVRLIASLRCSPHSLVALLARRGCFGFRLSLDLDCASPLRINTGTVGPRYLHTSQCLTKNIPLPILDTNVQELYSSVQGKSRMSSYLLPLLSLTKFLAQAVIPTHSCTTAAILVAPSAPYARSTLFLPMGYCVWESFRSGRKTPLHMSTI